MNENSICGYCSAPFKSLAAIIVEAISQEEVLNKRPRSNNKNNNDRDINNGERKKRRFVSLRSLLLIFFPLIL